MLYERKNINNWSNFIKEGNTIKIRQWDDMEKEYGLLDYDDTIINCEYTFADIMEDLCGEEFKISKTMEDDYKEDGYFRIYGYGYQISTDMIESIETDDVGTRYETTSKTGNQKEEIIKRLEKTLHYDRKLYDKMASIPLVYFTETVQKELQEDWDTYELIEIVKNKL